jgi:outer membrane lipoprotein-sorting protein
MIPSRILGAIFLIATLVGETGCLFHTRVVETRTSTAKLQTATKQQLVDQINTEAGKIKTLNATVNIATSVGGERKGKVTSYEEIRGYILVRKPDMLRMIGLFPIVRNKAFDMVSDGSEFKLSIPAKNKFYVGHNDVVSPEANPLENLRPQVIYNALLLPEINSENDIPVLEDSTEIIYDTKKRKELEQPDYVIDVIHRTGNQWVLARKIIFDRTNLVPHQQIIYDDKGAVATLATYQAYHDYNGVSFPDVIEINRPKEEYSIRLTVEKLVINDELRDDQFALTQPVGSQLVNLDQPQPNQAASSHAGAPAPDHNPAKK